MASHGGHEENQAAAVRRPRGERQRAQRSSGNRKARLVRRGRATSAISPTEVVAGNAGPPPLTAARF